MQRIIFLGVLLAGIAACDAGTDRSLDNAQASGHPETVPSEVSKPALASIPLREAQTRLPESWEVFAQKQSRTDAAYLARLDHRYFGAVSFATPEEREYMLRAGFPMPEDWLAARDMTDEQLRDAADAGDRKAAGMYADRMATRLTELFELNDANPEMVDDTERVMTATLAVNYARIAADGSSGTFGVYINGMVKSRMYRSPESLTAAMMEARRRGDPRVDRLIREMGARHPTQRIESIYALMKNF